MSLTGKSPSETYKDIAYVDNSNNGVTTTLKAIKTGDGSSSALSVSDRALQVKSATNNTGTIISGYCLYIAKRWTDDSSPSQLNFFKTWSKSLDSTGDSCIGRELATSCKYVSHRKFNFCHASSYHYSYFIAKTC